jgi:hypothetical protein
MMLLTGLAQPPSQSQAAAAVVVVVIIAQQSRSLPATLARMQHAGRGRRWGRCQRQQQLRPLWCGAAAALLPPCRRGDGSGGRGPHERAGDAAWERADQPPPGAPGVCADWLAVGVTTAGIRWRAATTATQSPAAPAAPSPPFCCLDTAQAALGTLPCCRPCVRGVCGVCARSSPEHHGDECPRVQSSLQNSSFSTLVSACGQSYFWQLASCVGLRYLAYMMPSFGFRGEQGRYANDANIEPSAAAGLPTSTVDLEAFAQFLRSAEFAALLEPAAKG